MVSRLLTIHVKHFYPTSVKETLKLGCLREVRYYHQDVFVPLENFLVTCPLALSSPLSPLGPISS